MTDVSRRGFLNAGALAGLGAVGLGSSQLAAAQVEGESVPTVEQAASELSHPDPSTEAVALYRYLHDVWGEGILSGQQHEPWGVDEMQYIEDVTGHQPAVQGADFIHDDKSHPVRQAREWWDRGGITSIMWHWGVPGQTRPSDEYEQSRDTGVRIDLQRVLEDGTEPNQAFWDEMAEVADQLAKLRDEGIPILWRPFHEFEGGWFWWGVEGPDFFVELWETMHQYFVDERDLDNLIWLLPHTGDPDPAWVPDSSTFDLWGGDTYDEGGASSGYAGLYDSVTNVHGETRPPILHESGQPPDPQAAADGDAWWALWMVWHTGHLTDTADDYLNEVYGHELTVTLSDLPDIVGEYGDDAPDCTETRIDPRVQVDGGAWNRTADVTVAPGTQVRFGPGPTQGGSWRWSGPGVSAETRELTVSPTESTTYTATYTNGCGVESTYEFTVTVTDDAGQPGPVGENAYAPRDPDDDGLYEDVNGDGATNLADAGDLFQHRDDTDVENHVEAFDFSGNDQVDLADVVQLFQENTN